MNKVLRETNTFFIYFTKIFFRNKGAVLGTIITPLFFLLLFGFIFGPDSGEKIKVGIFPSPSPIFIKTLNELSLKYIIYKNPNELKKDVEREKINLGIHIKGKSIKFYYNKNDIKNAPVMKGIANSIITKYEKRKHHIIILFPIEKHKVKIGKVQGGTFGYTIPGILAMSVLSLGMFSIIEIFARYRKLGILKKFSVTPMEPVSFMIGIILSRLILSLFTTFLIYFVSIIVFGINFAINVPLFILTILISGLSMSGFGALITLLFKEVSTASNVGSLLLTIMIFFSGVYFPITLLPKSLKIVSYALPLTYVAQNMRYVMGIEFINYKFFTISNVVMLVGGIILLWAASKKYVGKVG